MPKLIKQNSDGTKETYEGVQSSSGPSSQNEFPALNGAGKIDESFLPNGIGSDVISAVAGENLSAGDFVYFSSTGESLKADASEIAKQARGFVTTSITAGQSGDVFFDDTNAALTGLTPGATYYLSDQTPGQATLIAPTASGSIVQRLGFASGSETIHVDIEEPVKLA